MKERKARKYIIVQTIECVDCKLMELPWVLRWARRPLGSRLWPGAKPQSCQYNATLPPYRCVKGTEQLV